MSDWNDRVAHLLVGTERRPGVSEADMLRAVAVEATRHRAGAVAATLSPGLSYAPPESRPECSPKAAQLLELALAGQLDEMEMGGAVTAWVARCAAAGRIAAARHVPALLELGTRASALRADVHATIGERGRWVAAMSERWRWAAAAGDEPDPATVPIDVLVADLAARRKRDPEAGRDRIVAAAEGLAAAERAQLYQVLAVGLSPADEPLLESLLDDRSRKVQAEAAALLAALPGSRRAARMTGRIEPLVTRQRRKRWTVELPEDLDDQAERDGIVAKPPGGTGRKAWWLRQIVAGVPLAWWEEHLDADPARLTGAPPLPEVRLGWVDACLAQRDERWAAGLFDAHPEPALVGLLSPAEADRRLLAACRARKPDLAALARLLSAAPEPWSRKLTEAVLGVLRRHEDAPEAVRLLGLLGRADPDSVDDLAALATDYSGRAQRELRRSISWITFRTSLDEEFA